MLALSIDTSTPYLSLALQKDGRVDAVHLPANQKHAELILPELKTLLANNKVELKNIALIVYAQGPGSFTGLRIGVGVAQGLAFAHGIALMGIPNLDVLASIAPVHECVLCATDARMGEVFYVWYNTVSGERLSDYQVGKPEEILLLQKNAIGVGNAFSLYDSLPLSGQDIMPTARDFLPLIESGRYPQVAAEDASLLYVRNKIALTAKEQAKRKAATG